MPPGIFSSRLGKYANVANFVVVEEFAKRSGPLGIIHLIGVQRGSSIYLRSGSVPWKTDHMWRLWQFPAGLLCTTTIFGGSVTMGVLGRVMNFAKSCRPAKGCDNYFVGKYWKCSALEVENYYYSSPRSEWGAVEFYMWMTVQGPLRNYNWVERVILHCTLCPSPLFFYYC